MAAVDIRGELVKALKLPVPAILVVAALLGVSNAPEWTMAEIAPRVASSLVMGAMMCGFGLLALLAGLQVANARQNILTGWLAGLVVGFAGIAFMLWFYAAPVN